MVHKDDYYRIFSILVKSGKEAGFPNPEEIAERYLMALRIPKPDKQTMTCREEQTRKTKPGKPKPNIRRLHSKKGSDKNETLNLEALRVAGAEKHRAHVHKKPDRIGKKMQCGKRHPGMQMLGSHLLCQRQLTLMRLETEKWRPQDVSPVDFYNEGKHPQLWAASHVIVVFADADKVRNCSSCKKRFTDVFRMPQLWWSSYSRRSNGYFGCETFRDDHGSISALNTWSRFLVKQLYEKGHKWHKFNIFTRWIKSTQQTFLLVFEAPKQLRLRERFPDPLLTGSHNDALSDPYWFYPRLLEELSSLQDDSVWEVRNHVRSIEKIDPNGKPEPKYRAMHDTARHAIHVSETLQVAENTIAAIIKQHTHFQAEASGDSWASKAGYRHVTERLVWYDQILQSLGCRASANKERLLNEIQLAFNSVAQYDSRISVEIGQATQSDSAAMKTIAFVTLTFLPATFISAVFSMSFFKTNDNTGEWSVSDKFWIYWVVAIPVTLLTAGLWLLWQWLYQPPRIGEEEQPAKRLGDLIDFIKRGGKRGDGFEIA
ncbi:hypothetical protein F53441_4707 [Fusarium austroafricanum]|uniref:Uncharacterized protein n=1 Tax=Fusarium austroafricanum TaxID=2364996 RepID=A0A8H4KLD6_9HYPO|nr:hypothetical protein F53441_4707 [Fusarium austroafricanum]